MSTIKKFLGAPAGWHEFWAAKLVGASCKLRPDLHWTGSTDALTDKEITPSPSQLAAMSDVCESCPVRIACAEYALDDQLPAAGGMYAGVWIPWRPANGATDPSNRTKGWINARDRLRYLVQRWKFEALREYARNRAQIDAAARTRRNLSLSTEAVF